jgi:hypothetical protein
MSDKKKDIKAERQAPDAVPTPLKKQEPTAALWKEGGKTDPGAVIANDKSSVRNPVPCDK